MKTKLLAFVAGFVLFATNHSASSQTQEPSACAGPNPAGLSAPPAGDAAAKSIPFDQLGAEAQKQYTGDGVGITPTSDGARLRAAFQNLAAEATPDGLWLESTADEDAGQPARFRVRAVAIGREGGASAHLTDRGQVRATREAALYLRTGLIEEYTVSMDGVRQDFVLPQRPAGTGELRVELDVDGARTEAAADGAKLILNGSGRVIAYSRLHVADADGRELSARLEVKGPGCIRIQVDDSNATYPIRIDPTFSDADWVSLNPGIPGVDGSVSALAMSGASLYAGGYFTLAGGVMANCIAKWNGSTWSALGAGMDGRVSALAVDGAGNLYAGGYFTTAGEVVVNSIAKWDGSAWSALGTGMNGGVYALASDDEGQLYAGGSFTTAGGELANYIAKWNGIVWSSLGYGMNGAVYALGVAGTDLYAGGSFTAAGGELANRIAKWDCIAWSALGAGMNDSVFALAVDAAGQLYAGGLFTSAGGVAANRIAKWDGSAWSALGAGMSTGKNDYVRALAISGTVLYAAGFFPSAGGEVVNSIAKWDGNAWSALDSGMNNRVYNLAVDSAGHLYAGGDFTSAGRVGVGVSRIAKWDGSAWSALGSGMNNDVWTLAVDGAGNFYAGGSFTSAGGVEVNHVAKWDGNSWSALGKGTNYPVYELAVDGDDNLYAGGYFTTAGDVAANNIAKWNGSTWSALGSGMNDRVAALAVDGAGNLYAGGSFTGAGDVAANNIAKWNGSTWSALGAGMDGRVSALAVDGAGNLYAGGNFTTAGGVVANSIAKWNGNTWSALGTGMDGSVYALAVDGEGQLYAGGYFTSAGEVVVNSIAKWNGSAWSSLGAGMGAGMDGDGVVGVLAVDVAGQLYAGGEFTTAGGVMANNIAKWDGSAWSALGTGMNNTVDALALDGTGHLYAGGSFITAGTTVSPYIVQANIMTPLENWRQTWYDTTHNTGNAADLADPHHTGIPNLMVFAFLGPNQNPELASLSQMPAAQSGGGNYFIRFTRPAGVAGVSYGAQWSPNLQEGSWQPLPDTGSGSQHLFSLQMAGKPSAFIRLTLTNPLTTLTPLENWRLTWYGTTSNTGNAADLADPYHTGIPNLLVFAMLGPDQNPSLASLSQLPAAQSSGGNYFISFSQPTGVSGVTYGAQWSPNLAAGSWLPLADTGIAPEHLFSLPMAGQPRAFIRLTVSDP